jgi:alpha-L-arabinofuranosidase
MAVMKFFGREMTTIVVSFGVMFGSGIVGSEAADNITVNLSSVIRSFTHNPVGINCNYLQDDNANRSSGSRTLQDALKGMGAGWIRYPGGEKSDWHLWSTSPFSGPNPQVYGWYTGKAGNLLNFDEYMQYMKDIGGEPYIVVGYDSQVRTGISKQQYLDNAVSWVRYANQTKKYNVKFWEIGNENWYNNTATPQAMASIVEEFSIAMKAVDPSIKIGSSGNGASWWEALIGKSRHVDFLVVSNYSCWEWKSYDYYRNNDEVNLVPQAESAVNGINTYASATDKERLFVVVAEYNSMDFSTNGWPEQNTLGHALVSFEIAGQILKNKKIYMGALWNTRWGGDAIWNGFDESNNLLPSGRAVAIWGQYFGKDFLDVSRTRYIKTFACRDETGKVNVFLINKDNVSHTVTVSLQNGQTAFNDCRTSVFSGTGSGDMNPTWRSGNSEAVSDNRIQNLNLAPVSITVLSFGNTTGTGKSNQVKGLHHRCAVPTIQMHAKGDKFTGGFTFQGRKFQPGKLKHAASGLLVMRGASEWLNANGGEY